MLSPDRTKMPERPAPTNPLSRLEDVRRSEQIMVQVRWAAVVLATVQVLAYHEAPYPPGLRTTALLLVAALGLANVAIWLVSRRTHSLPAARLLSMGALTVDIVVASGFVWVYTFDQLSALWAALFVLPLEGAIRFGLAGALAAWAGATAVYTAREVWGSREYDYPFLWNSVSFRMGIGFLIALVAGLMARSLLRQRAHLEDTLGEMRRTDALRSRLVATLAHDVRNPLTTIRGTLNTLARHGKRLDETTRDEIVRTADHQAERLERLATDLLDLARLEAGRLDLHLEETNLRGVVERALSYTDPAGRYDNEVPADLAVVADAGRLEQIAVNLALNAVRYGHPPFVVEAGVEDGDRLVLRFRDHGPGVRPEEREALFEPFRAELDRGSVGLGLAIVKALVEAHGGEVAYEPNHPRGAVFRVSLPVAGPGDERGAPRHRGAPA
jgi:signal transduction histidine kinase